MLTRRDDVTESRVSQIGVLYRRIDDVLSLRVDAVGEVSCNVTTRVQVPVIGLIVTVVTPPLLAGVMYSPRLSFCLSIC